VFVEDVLHSDRFGPAGFVNRLLGSVSTEDGHAFRERRSSLLAERSRLIPFVENGNELHGMAKRRYKLNVFGFRTPRLMRGMGVTCDSR